MAPEQEIILRCQQGDNDAFHEIYRAYRSQIYRLAYRYTRHEEETHDLVQLIFARIYSRIQGYRHEASLSTWIFRVAHSVCLNCSDSKRHIEVPMEPDVTQADPSVESNPLAYLLAREDRQLIYEALASLSDQQRTIFVFKVVRQWSYAEIAEALGISATVVP